MQTKKYSLLLLILIGTSCFAQNYKEGFFINKDGKKTSCFFKPFTLSQNPNQIVYKLTPSGKDNYLILEEQNEIGVGKNEYVIAKVEIDNRSNVLKKLGNLDFNHQFKFETKTLLLKVLESGEATLYESNLNKIKKYFFKTQENNEIKQLLFKKYFAERHPFSHASDFAVHNNAYQRQLASEVTCKKKNGKIKFPLYFSKGKLISYFKKYNAGKCRK